MLTSINHHMAILHLRIHQRYLDIVTTGDSQQSQNQNQEEPWYVLKLRRTRWYNLLDGGDRVEALRGVWEIFHCMMRARA